MSDSGPDTGEAARLIRGVIARFDRDPTNTLPAPARQDLDRAIQVLERESAGGET